MMVIVLACLQALSGELPRESRLRLVFFRDASPPRGKLVTGLASNPTRWSSRTLQGIVRGCGGRNLTASRDDGYAIAVTVPSGADDLRIARCVQASTSLDFRVGVQEMGFAAVHFDDTRFRELWRPRR